MTRSSRPLSLLAALAALLVGAAPAAAARGTGGAVVYVARALQGGCASEPGAAGFGVTAWGLIGLGATGRRAPAAASCLERTAAGLRSATDLELAILADAAAGRDPRRSAGRNLVAALLRLRRGGRLGPLANVQIFGVLALRAAGAPVPVPVRRALLAAQARDGSFPLLRGAPPDSNLTAAGVEALRALGLPAGSARVRRSLRALARFARPHGGFALDAASGSDAQSTAWAAQARAACGRPIAAQRAYLLRLQRPDGSIRYSPTSGQTPIWVTGQALAALAGRPLPVRLSDAATGR